MIIYWNDRFVISKNFDGNNPEIIEYVIINLDSIEPNYGEINDIHRFKDEKEIAYEGSLGCYLNNDNFVEQNCFGCINYSISSLKGDLLYTGLASDFHEDIARNDVFENMTLIKVQYIKRNGEAIVVFVENEF